MRKLIFVVIGLGVFIIMAATAPPAFAVSIYDTAESYWQFNLSGNPTLDTTGNHTGTASGGSWTSGGRIGGGYSFDGLTGNVGYVPHEGIPGTSSYINVGNNSSYGFGDNFTISAWFKPNADADGGALYWPNIIGSNTIDTEFGQGWSLYIDGGTVSYEESIGTGWADYMGVYADGYSLGEWAHIAIVGTGDMRYAYLNGQLLASENFGYSMAQSGTNVYIAANQNYIWTQSEFDGSLDEIALWNTSLSASEVAALYKTGAISDAVLQFGFNYTTDEINQLAELYLNGGSGSLLLGGTTWYYVADNNPLWDLYSTRTLGDTFNQNGVDYLYLGDSNGGISSGNPFGGGGPAGVPEPSSMAVSGIAIGLFGLIKRFRKTRDQRP